MALCWMNKAMHVESKITDVQRTIQIGEEQSIVKPNNLRMRGTLKPKMWFMDVFDMPIDFVIPIKFYDIIEEANQSSYFLLPQRKKERCLDIEDLCTKAWLEIWSTCISILRHFKTRS